MVRKMNHPMKDLLVHCVWVVVALYGSISLLTEVLRTILPFGIILALILAAALYTLRNPLPDVEAVEAILGKEPHLVTDVESYVLKTVAHRGAGLDAPENSLAAFTQCNDRGCDAIEFDVTLTKDEVPVVFHDSSLERMADQNIKINEHKWEELCNVDISVLHPFRDRFVKTNIPTLEQTVTQLLASRQRMFIDIKDNDRRLVRIIHDLYTQHPDLYSRAVVTSFFPNIIYLIRRGDPKIVCSMAWRPHCFAYDSYNYPQGKGVKRATNLFWHTFLSLCDILHEWALPRITYYICGISVILLHKDVLTGRAILQWRQKGVRAMAWTINTPPEKQFVARTLKITYLTDTLTGEGTTHSSA